MCQNFSPANGLSLRSGTFRVSTPIMLQIKLLKIGCLYFMMNTMTEDVAREGENVIFLFTVTQTELSWPELTHRHMSCSAAEKHRSSKGESGVERGKCERYLCSCHGRNPK